MGYPMTYKRVTSRNSLSQGDYSTGPSFTSCVNTNPKDDACVHVSAARREQVEMLERQFRLLCGDLRRLERDACDEGPLCQHIAQRTGIDAEIVAAVLKEFVNY